MELDQQFEAANQKGHELQVLHPRAVSAHYDRRTGRIVIRLSSLVEISFSPHDAEGLDDASPSELERIEISPSGFGIHFPRLDADLHVPALLAGRLGSQRWRSGQERAATTHERADSQSEPAPRTWEVKLGKKHPWRGLRPIQGGLLASRSPERANAKIEKNGNHDGGDHKHTVVGSLGPARAHAPEIWRKDDYRQQEENSGDFEPDDASRAAKRSEESADPPRESGTLLSIAPPGRAPRLRSRAPSRAVGLNWRIYRGLRLGSDDSLSLARQHLSHHAASDAYADSHGTSNSQRSHPIYDGSSDQG